MIEYLIDEMVRILEIRDPRINSEDDIVDPRVTPSRSASAMQASLRMTSNKTGTGLFLRLLRFARNDCDGYAEDLGSINL